VQQLPSIPSSRRREPLLVRPLFRPLPNGKAISCQRSFSVMLRPRIVRGNILPLGKSPVYLDFGAIHGKCRVFPAADLPLAGTNQGNMTCHEGTQYTNPVNQTGRGRKAMASDRC
jgi:hypothetical protein